MRDELQNETLFRNLAHARIVIVAWATSNRGGKPLRKRPRTVQINRTELMRWMSPPNSVAWTLCRSFEM